MRSQEVRGHTFNRPGLRLPGCWLVLLVPGVQHIVDLHNRSQVAASIAVVRRREDRQALFIVEFFVSFHGELVGSADHP